VYRAESTAFAHSRYEEPMGWLAVQAAAERIADDPWWVAATGGCRPVVVKARRDAAVSSSVSVADQHSIRVAPGHGTWVTLSHEHAHVLAHRTDPTAPGHGSLFRGAHLAVASRVLGPVGAAMLARAYDLHGLSATAAPSDPPPWQPPTPHGMPHGIAELHNLAERGA
jgi:hypothetical protein